MVALLVRLKLTILRNSLRRSVWRTVGMALGALYALSLVVTALLIQLALRVGPPEYAAYLAPVSVLGFSALTAGWLVMPLLAAGIDDTVDPGRFALLPVRARDLQPGLLVCAVLGVPGTAAVLVSLGQPVAWSRSLPSVVATLLGVPLGLVTCVLLARVGTVAFARLLSTRRFRELAAAVLMVGIGSLGLLGTLSSRGVTGAFGRREAILPTLERAAAVVGWTPFGWAWSAPAAVSAPDGSARWGGIPVALVKLALAAGLVGILWRVWERMLDRALVSPLQRGGDGGKVHSSPLLDRLGERSPVGAVAAKSLRYWRRDPRYLTGGLTTLTVPLLFVVTNAATTGADAGALLFLAPLALGFFAGTTLAQELSYDGSALWLHVTSGISGRSDRAGRVLALLTLVLPVLLLSFVVLTVVTGRTDLVLPASAAAVAVLLGGLGGGAWVGAWFQVAVPPPGHNPFQAHSGGGIEALVSFALTVLVMTVSASPALVLAGFGLDDPRVAVIALLVALVVGGATLALGVRRGGARLDAAWPEVLSAVTLEEH